jgi:uncharacterized protein with PIN domain
MSGSVEYDTAVTIIVTGDSSTRSKARRLALLGIPTKSIAKLLGKRYQQIDRALEDIKEEIEHLQGTKRCKHCNRPLHDPVHQEVGVGPICQLRKSLENKQLRPKTTERKEKAS